MRKYKYNTSLGKRFNISIEMRELLKERTLPFLDNVGINKPLNVLLEEVYLQGMKDAMQAMNEL